MALDFTLPDPQIDLQTLNTMHGSAELEQRKNGWRALLQQWNDPNVRAAVMQTGLGLMRSPGYGQSGWDVGANALQSGVNTLASLRERERILSQEAADRAQKLQQQDLTNKRMDEQLAISRQNATTQAQNIEQQREQARNANNRAGFTLEETIRHNREMEGIGRANAAANAMRATNTGKGGKTSAEIEKINRLKAFYLKQDPNLSEEEADKRAIDYVSNAKGKPPRVLMLELMKEKAKRWYDNQLDPTARHTPDQEAAWQQEAINEVRLMQEEGGKTLDGVTSPPASPSTPTPVSASEGQTPPFTIAPPLTPATVSAPSEATVRSIERWKAAKATPEQIAQLIRAGGEDPKIYGYTELRK